MPSDGLNCYDICALQLRQTFAYNWLVFLLLQTVLQFFHVIYVFLSLDLKKADGNPKLVNKAKLSVKNLENEKLS